MAQNKEAIRSVMKDIITDKELLNVSPPAKRNPEC